MRNIEHQIDLLFSRQEQLRKDSEKRLREMRQLIPLTDLKERATLQSEMIKVSATLNLMATWAQSMDERLTQIEEGLQEARDVMYRAGMFEEE